MTNRKPVRTDSCHSRPSQEAHAARLTASYVRMAVSERDAQSQAPQPLDRQHHLTHGRAGQSRGSAEPPPGRQIPLVPDNPTASRQRAHPAARGHRWGAERPAGNPWICIGKLATGRRPASATLSAKLDSAGRSSRAAVNSVLTRPPLLSPRARSRTRGLRVSCRPDSARTPARLAR